MSTVLEAAPVVVIGTGRTADVLAWNRDWVVKLFHQGLPHAHEHALREGLITTAVRKALGAASFRVPEVGEVVSLEARAGLLYRRADGALLARAYARDDTPRFARQIGERLAQLHRGLHRLDARRLPALDVLPDQQECFRQAITWASALPDNWRQPLLHLLEQTDGSARRICHGDFHPHNILQDEHGTATVIDWITAERGAPLGDVARTSVLLRFAPTGAAKRIDPAEANLRAAVERAYLNHYFAGDDNTRAQTEYERWLTLAAAARFAEGIGETEQSALCAFIAHRL